MSLASRSSRGALLLGVSAILNIGVGFLGGVFLARILNPNDFGTFALASTIMAFVDIRSKLQIEQKFLRDSENKSEYIDTFFTVITGLTGISSIILCAVGLGAIWLEKTDLAICLILMAVFYLLDPWTATIRLSIEKQVAFRAISFIQTTTSLVQFAVTFGGAVLGLGLWSLVLGSIINVLLNFLIYIWIAPYRPRWNLNPALGRAFLAFGIKYGIVTYSSTTILYQFDNLIVGFLGGTGMLGFYDRAYRTANWPILLVSASLGRVALPTYAKLQSDSNQLAKAVSLMLWLVLALSTPITLTFFLTAPDLVLVLYGAKWLPSVPVLQALAVFAVSRPLMDVTFAILLASNRPGQLTRLVFGMAIFMVALVTPLTWFLGSVGTAIGVGITFTIVTVFLLHFGHTHLGIHLWESAGHPLVSSLLALVAYLVLRAYLPFDQLSLLPRLIFETGFVLGLYILASLLTGYHLMVRQARLILKIMHR